MTEFRPFAMERWQSTWENRVAYNLSESGVHPLTLGELLALAGGVAADTLRAVGGVGALDLLQLGYGQSNGSDELRARIARLYEGGDAEGVVVTNGSAEANFVALWELVQPGDEVVILVPTYMQSWGLAEALGARVVPVALREELGWQADPAEIEAAIGERTRVVVVTNPGNPTGRALGDEAIDALLAAVQRTGAWILADEVYAGAEREGGETRSLFGRHERVIATGSLSKAYGLPGLRIGWAATDPDTAERLWTRTDYTTISPGALTDALAGIALEPGVRQKLLDRTRARIRDGLAILEAWLHDAGTFAWHAPDAGAICYTRYDAPLDSESLAERLRVEQSVLVVPGAHFGMGNYIRFGFGLPPAELRAALERCAAVFRTLAAARTR
jgi:aspartate/methionine/tyrosine aminotransferase